MKNLQQFYLSLYRSIGLFVLIALVCIILWYGFSVVFFGFSKTWSIPVVLSPTQERVIGQLARISSFQQELEKNKVDLQTTVKSIENKKAILNDATSLQQRIKLSMNNQSERYNNASQSLNKILGEKKRNIQKLSKLASEIKLKERLIDKELKAGIITKYESNNQQLVLNNIQQGLTDSKANALLLQQQVGDLVSSAQTYKGANSNFDAITGVSKQVELEAQIAEIKNELLKLQATQNNLEAAINDNNSVLELIKNSPYYLATKGPTTVTFVPYANLQNVKVGDKVFSCYASVVLCKKVGEVASIYNAEEYAIHPIFRTNIKGQFVGVLYDNGLSDSKSDVLFIGSKPLLF